MCFLYTSRSLSPPSEGPSSHSVGPPVPASWQHLEGVETSPSVYLFRHEGPFLDEKHALLSEVFHPAGPVILRGPTRWEAGASAVELVQARGMALYIVIRQGDEKVVTNPGFFHFFFSGVLRVEGRVGGRRLGCGAGRGRGGGSLYNYSSDLRRIMQKSGIILRFFSLTTWGGGLRVGAWELFRESFWSASLYGYSSGLGRGIRTSGSVLCFCWACGRVRG